MNLYTGPLLCWTPLEHSFSVYFSVGCPYHWGVLMVLNYSLEPSPSTHTVFFPRLRKKLRRRPGFEASTELNRDLWMNYMLYYISSAHYQVVQHLLYVRLWVNERRKH